MAQYSRPIVNVENRMAFVPTTSCAFCLATLVVNSMVDCEVVGKASSMYEYVDTTP